MTSKHPFTHPLLNNSNYHDWKGNATAFLRQKQIWRLVKGEEVRPSVAGEEQRVWDQNADMAAGFLWDMVEPSQRSHFRNYEDSPVRIWSALQQAHTTLPPGARFNAYDSLFSLRKRDDEKLVDYGNRM